MGGQAPRPPFDRIITFVFINSLLGQSNHADFFFFLFFYFLFF